MGLFDKIQAAANDLAAQQAEQSQAATDALHATLPPDAPRARTDVIRVSPQYRSSTLAAYIAIVGLQPEDVYGIVPQHNNDVTVGFEVLYRDRPEYEAGRQAWAAQGA